MDVGAPTGETLREIIPQAAETLEGVHLVGGRFVASYLKDAHTQVKVFDTGGKLLAEVPFPGLGTATGFDGKADDAETFFSYTSYTVPPSIYRYDVAHRRNTQGVRAEAGLRPGGVHDGAGVLPEQGRHARADVHLLQSRDAEERRESRPCSMVTAGSAFR